MGLFNVCDLVAHFSYDMSVKAVCVLLGETVKGVLHFEQQGAEAVQIKGEVTGLTAGNHGFHVHEFGDYSNGCMSAGGHFNPANQQHGGDLGNITATDSRVATVDINDSLIQLSGENSIIGRTVVVHADPDDLGKGGVPLSLTTGNAGARVACGVIGIAKQ